MKLEGNYRSTNSFISWWYLNLKFALKLLNLGQVDRNWIDMWLAEVHWNAQLIIEWNTFQQMTMWWPLKALSSLSIQFTGRMKIELTKWAIQARIDFYLFDLKWNKNQILLKSKFMFRTMRGRNGSVKGR